MGQIGSPENPILLQNSENKNGRSIALLLHWCFNADPAHWVSSSNSNKTTGDVHGRIRSKPTVKKRSIFALGTTADVTRMSHEFQPCAPRRRRRTRRLVVQRCSLRGEDRPSWARPGKTGRSRIPPAGRSCRCGKLLREDETYTPKLSHQKKMLAGRTARVIGGFSDVEDATLDTPKCTRRTQPSDRILWLCADDNIMPDFAEQSVLCL